MENDNIPTQEKIYTNLNKLISSTITSIKWFIYPLIIIFIFVAFLFAIFYGMDIVNLDKELNSIKSNLDLKLKDIDIKERETNLVVQESLAILKKKQEEIDSALITSNGELAKLTNNSKTLSEYSNSIKQTINEAKNKYSSEIEYATKGADQRKKDIEQNFQESNKLLLNLADIIENTTHYIEENSRGLIADESYDATKVKLLNRQLKQQLIDFKKKLQKK